MTTWLAHPTQPVTGQPSHQPASPRTPAPLPLSTNQSIIYWWRGSSLALRWRSLQQALKGRIDDLMDKERLLALLEERRNQITRNKRQQPIIFIEPGFEENNENNEIDDENDQQQDDNVENDDEPMMLIIEEKQQPESPQFLDDNQLFFMSN
uniref:Uncharacterized protein n=1 Tax=Meloidogyne enterolobii TaxID=390850 RepID=A0A6V7WA39_MELEN|nr:unnamed protein product [Meloidogyne enterolobii]